ncbi:hypothetical protein BG262_03715 [Floricoccus penangensis]|uniref:DUF4209 domain-containing protein n=1 Tax=Floricoccus penangensis TaxID=1859475 RepID=A0A9Q5JGD9_9LACT|nr:hypothetical protein [Floricoccus penangensis]OFI46907.1 hypothetical protein BG262_03715 [Floricoccus penangensis]
MSRVKFYNKEGLLTKIQDINFYDFVNNNIELEINSILDILESVNILKFIKNDCIPNDVDKGKIKSFRDRLNKGINIYLSKIEDRDMEIILEYLYSNREYPTDEFMDILTLRKDIFECIADYNFVMSGDALLFAVRKSQVPIIDMLRHKAFIEKYQVEVKELFLENEKNIELIIDKYVKNGNDLVVPSNISKYDLYLMCERYIASKKRNINYLKLIEEGIQGMNNFEIDSKLRLKAKKAYEEEFNHFSKDSNSFFEFGEKIELYNDFDKYKEAKSRFKTLLNKDFFHINLTYEEHLDYLMHLNGFFTNNWILNLVSFPNIELPSALLREVYFRSNNSYETSFDFDNKNLLITYAFLMYQKIIKDICGIRIEDLIEYFFTKFSKENFSVTWLPFEFASAKEKIKIQANSLFVIEEQVRKQWKLYQENNIVDEELYNYENTPNIGDLGSLLNKKYIYASDKIKDMLNLFFSDQSDITYINENLKADDFFQLIIKYNLKVEDFNSYQRDRVRILIENNIVSLDTNGNIVLNNEQLVRIGIYKQLYNYGVIHYYHYFNNMSPNIFIELNQHEIDEMIKEGYLIYENKLFSTQESDYLNFILNNTFNNGLGLRNGFAHGSVTKENNISYSYALIILIIYIIKINEELQYYCML